MTTEWFDEQPCPGPHSHDLDMRELMELVKSVRVSYQQAASHMTETFERIGKQLFPNPVQPPDIPQKPYTPPVRNHGPRQGKPYRSDGKRKW